VRGGFDPTSESKGCSRNFHEPFHNADLRLGDIEHLPDDDAFDLLGSLNCRGEPV
jgi:hypothetical protein